MNLFHSLFWSTVLAGCLLTGLFTAAAMVWFWNYREQRSGRRNPLSQHLLRSPGQSIRDQIEDLRWNVAILLCFTVLPGPLGIALYLADWVARERQPTAFVTGFLSLAVAISLAFLLRKLWVALSRVRDLRLGYEAELAVGQELNELGRLGYRVFHDVPVEEREFNVDHVLVGPAGVFAVETKGRAKPEGRKGRQGGWEVQYDGIGLQFPGWFEKRPLEQAVAISSWVMNWLSSAVGERLTVQPMLMLPGWYIKRTSAKGILVSNGRHIDSYFAKFSPDPRMTGAMIQRIAHQLDERCRDVEPRAYAKDKK